MLDLGYLSYLPIVHHISGGMIENGPKRTIMIGFSKSTKIRIAASAEIKKPNHLPEPENPDIPKLHWHETVVKGWPFLRRYGPKP